MKIIKKIKYQISSILIITVILFILFFIVGIYNNNVAILTFTGSILMAGVTFSSLVYTMIYNKNKFELKKESIRSILSEEVITITALMESLLNAIESNNLNPVNCAIMKDRIIVWDKLVQDVPEAFEPEEIKHLYIFFSVIKEINKDYFFHTLKFGNTVEGIKLIKKGVNHGNWLIKNSFKKEGNNAISVYINHLLNEKK